jgi:hypothetical protein
MFLSVGLAQLCDFGASLNLRYCTLGRTKLKIYFPVQRGYGLRMAGYGIASRSSIHMTRFIRSSCVMNVSLEVRSIVPSKESWTIPMIGLLD